MAENAIMLHKDFIDILKNLTDEQYGVVMRAVHNYQFYDIQPDMADPLLLTVCNAVLMNVDRNNEYRAAKATAGAKGGKAKQSNSIADSSKTKQNEANLSNDEANAIKGYPSTSSSTSTSKEKNKKENLPLNEDTKEPPVKANPQNKQAKVYLFKEPIAEYTDDPPLQEALEAWIEIRLQKKSKKPFTEKALKYNLARLDKLAGGDTAYKRTLVENAVANGWDGFWPDKSKEKNINATGVYVDNTVPKDWKPKFIEPGEAEKIINGEPYAKHV